MAVLFAAISLANFVFALIYYFGPSDLKYLFLITTGILIVFWLLTKSVLLGLGSLFDVAGVVGGALDYVPFIVAAILGSVLIMTCVFEYGTNSSSSAGSHA